jgi:hypothetical protein
LSLRGREAAERGGASRILDRGGAHERPTRSHRPQITGCLLHVLTVLSDAGLLRASGRHGADAKMAHVRHRRPRTTPPLHPQRAQRLVPGRSSAPATTVARAATAARSESGTVHAGECCVHRSTAAGWDCTTVFCRAIAHLLVVSRRCSDRIRIVGPTVLSRGPRRAQLHPPCIPRLRLRHGAVEAHHRAAPMPRLHQGTRPNRRHRVLHTSSEDVRGLRLRRGCNRPARTSGSVQLDPIRADLVTRATQSPRLR